MAYPSHHSLVEKIAAKVITRVVKDGVTLSNAIKEAIEFAELDRQQTIHMCSILQDYGMVYNGDHNNYFHMPEDMGKDFPNTPNGYVVYASEKDGGMDRIFGAIAEFKKAGLTDAEIQSFNPNLAPILEAIKGIETNYLDIVEEVRSGQSPEAETQYSWEPNQPTQPVGETKPFTPFGVEQQPQEELLQAANAKRGNFFKLAQEAEVETASPDNIKESLQEANAEPAAEGGDLGGDLDAPKEETEVSLDDESGLGNEDLGDDLGGDDLGGGVKATVKPSPDDLEKEVSSAPKWEVENILSIQIAENYYGNMRKKLDSVVFNENIMLDAESMKKYDAVRQKIDEQIEKIGEAQKQTKKLEKKENDLEQEFEVGAEEPTDLEAKPEDEVPTEELVVENPTEEKVGE